MKRAIHKSALCVGVAALLIGALIAVVQPPPASATAFDLAFPLDCVPGEDCWVLNYLDHEAGPGARDYACGPRSYDGHRGTDLAIRDRAAMRAGVTVLAGAPGRVVGARDGMADTPAEVGSTAAPENRECGNGVRIDHGGGWVTQYCHMKRGSIRVAAGDLVDGGQALGQVGLSGKTEFPHLHLLVEKDGKALDPFVGPSGGEACAPGSAPLWQPDALALLAYQGAALYNAGFADEAPLGENIIEGRYRRASFPQDAPALVFWMEAFGVRAGDRLRVRLEGPSGTVAENDEVLTKDQARRWAFVGRKRPGAAWPAGRYRGEAILRRETPSGPMSWRISRSVSVR